MRTRLRRFTMMLKSGVESKWGRSIRPGEQVNFEVRRMVVRMRADRWDAKLVVSGNFVGWAPPTCNALRDQALRRWKGPITQESFSPALLRSVCQATASLISNYETNPIFFEGMAEKPLNSQRLVFRQSRSGRQRSEKTSATERQRSLSLNKIELVKRLKRNP